MNDDNEPAELTIEEPRNTRLRGISLVWLVPLLAVIVSIGVAWRTYSERGTLIEIEFVEVAGIQVGETVLKFREVEVGRVEAVTFTSDLTRVLVSVRVDKDVAPFIDSDASFWLVRPELTTSGISRLDTVLSGTFIEGLWDNEVTETATRFVALDAAPLSRTPGSGTWVTLVSPDGGTMAEGAPVIYRGIKVGQLRNVRLDPGSTGVLVDAFVSAPYDKRLSTASVFWDISGFSVSLGPQGLKLNVRSLASVVQGGVEFTTLVTGGESVDQGTKFRVFEDEQTARSSLFSNEIDRPVTVSILLDGSVRNLAVGAPVQFRGLDVGEISALSVRSDDSPGGTIFRQQVDLTLSPSRMGLPDGLSEGDVLRFLQEQVAEEKLRAQITSIGILGSSLIVDLVPVPDAETAVFEMDAEPFPIMPVVPPDIADISTASNEVLARIQKLPIEDLLRSATDTLDTVRAFVAKDETQKAPEAVVGLVDDLRKFVGSDDVQAAPKALRGTLDEAQSLLAELNKGDGAQRVLTAIDNVSTAATAVTDAATGLPALVATLTELSNTAKELPLRELADSAKQTVEEIGTFIGSEDMAGLPKTLNDALEQARQMLVELREGGSVTNLNAALESAKSAAASVEKAGDELPQLVERLNGTVTRIDELVAGYGQRSPFGQDVNETLRELKAAAVSIGSLARTIERNPQAFLLGR